ncbi:unnamed protein product, partial [Closterium sp. NIES-54]
HQAAIHGGSDLHVSLPRATPAVLPHAHHVTRHAHRLVETPPLPRPSRFPRFPFRHPVRGVPSASAHPVRPPRALRNPPRPRAAGNPSSRPRGGGRVGGGKRGGFPVFPASASMRFDPVGLSLPNHYPIARSAIPIGRTAPFAQYSCEFRSANPAASRNVLSQCNRPRCLLIRRFPRSRNQITMSADVAQTADVAEPADWRVLITFDVDGTLIHSVGSESNKLHKRAFAHAMKKVFGIQGTIDAIQ